MFDQATLHQLADALAKRMRTDKPKPSDRWPELMSVDTAAASLDRTPNAIKHLVESKILPCCQIESTRADPACRYRSAD